MDKGISYSIDHIYLIWPEYVIKGVLRAMEGEFRARDKGTPGILTQFHHRVLGYIY